MALAVINVFTNESHKTKSFNDIDHDSMVALEARIMAIEGVGLYDPVQAVEMCLVPKKFQVPKFVKYTRT